MDKIWYYYLHTNGDLIGKNPIVVESDSEYFNSPFVKHVWRLDLTDRMSLISFLIEAKQLGASSDRLKDIALTNKVTDKDYDCYAKIKSGEDRNKVIEDIYGS